MSPFRTIPAFVFAWLATAPAAAQTNPAAPACTSGAPLVIDPAGGHLIGAWRDPADGSLHAAVAAPREIRVWQIGIGWPSNHEFTAVLPGHGAMPMRAWRAASGDLLVSWRTGRADRLQLSRAGSLHVGHLALGTVTDIPFARPPRTAEERALGPLDDPSASRIAGLMLFTRTPGQAGESPGLAMVDTTHAPTPIGPGASGVLVGGTNLDDVAFMASDGTLLISGENGIGSAIVRNQQDYEQLGPHGSYDLGRFTVDRLSRAQGSGFPRMVMTSPTEGLAIWSTNAATPGGPIPLLVQPIDAHGHPTGEPITHSLGIADRQGIVAPALRDVARVESEVWVTVQTAADDATGHRSTLVRLDSHGASIAPPINLALDAPRIVPVPGEGAIAWSETDNGAVLVRCTSTTPPRSHPSR